MGGVFGEARVPEHGDGVLRDVERSRPARQSRCAGALRKARRTGQNEIALGDDLEGRRELRYAKGDAALQSAVVEDSVDQARALAPWRDEDVIEAGECFERQPPTLERGVPGS